MSTLQITAGYLPAGFSEDVPWQTLNFESAGQTLEVRVPSPTPTQLTALAQHVRQAAQNNLQRMTVTELIGVIDRAVAQLLDRDHPHRLQAQTLLPRITGLDADTVRLGLTGYLKTFRAPQLHRFVAEDFANPKLLDEFQPRPKGGMAKAMGPGLMAHVWAGNVPGLPLWSLISGLLVKAGHVGKVSSSEPLMASLFVQALVALEPRLADALAVVGWKGGDTAREQALFTQADVVAAYGGNAALTQVRQQVPITTRFLPFGHKLSFAMVARSALDARQAPLTAQQLAHDVTRYDQQGCYSPQLVYVERGGAVPPIEFAQQVHSALQALTHAHPRRRLSLEESAAVAAWRQQHELQSFNDAGITLLGDAASPVAVVFTEYAQALSPSALNRSLLVVVVDRLEEVAPLIAPQRDYLQTVGVAADPQQLLALAEQLAQVGVTRLCALGAMTSPEAGWHHDGRFNLLDLVRMVEVEQSAEDAAESFAPYRD
jgi:Acyl-CoA reductase (LuxC)